MSVRDAKIVFRDVIFKLLRSLGIDSKELSIPTANVACTITLFLLGSKPP